MRGGKGPAMKSDFSVKSYTTNSDEVKSTTEGSVISKRFKKITQAFTKKKSKKKSKSATTKKKNGLPPRPNPAAAKKKTATTTATVAASAQKVAEPTATAKETIQKAKETAQKLLQERYEQQQQQQQQQQQPHEKEDVPILPKAESNKQEKEAEEAPKPKLILETEYYERDVVSGDTEDDTISGQEESSMTRRARETAELAAEKEYAKKESVQKQKMNIANDDDVSEEPEVIPEPSEGESTHHRRRHINKQRDVRVRAKEESFTDTLARICAMCDLPIMSCGADATHNAATSSNFPMDVSVLTEVESRENNYVRVSTTAAQDKEESPSVSSMTETEEDTEEDDESSKHDEQQAVSKEEEDPKQEEECKASREETTQDPVAVIAETEEPTKEEEKVSSETEVPTKEEEKVSSETEVPPKEEEKVSTETEEHTKEDEKVSTAESKNENVSETDKIEPKEETQPEEKSEMQAPPDNNVEGESNTIQSEERDAPEPEPEEPQQQDEEAMGPHLDVFMTKEQRTARREAERIELEKLRSKRRHFKNLQKPRGMDDIEKARLQNVSSDVSDSAETYTIAFRVPSTLTTMDDRTVTTKKSKQPPAVDLDVTATVATKKSAAVSTRSIQDNVRTHISVFFLYSFLDAFRGFDSLLNCLTHIIYCCRFLF